MKADSLKENRAHTSCCSPALVTLQMIKLSGMQSLANYMEKGVWLLEVVAETQEHPR